ncbi:MAG: superoxide dismutase family protein [Parachlamydiaceae bacterium]|nr:superoxide dismutase family protein [Parachlamydiaceae bacterium]
MYFTELLKLLTGITVLSGALVASLEAKEYDSSKKAYVLLSPTKGNRAHGSVTFITVEDGVKIIADVEGLSPGKHGFHIHEYGDCSAHDGSSTGGYYNPLGAPHGGPDHINRRLGDLGNIVADESGKGHYERVDNLISLSGPHSIVGRSVVVNDVPDDFTSQSTGNVGKFLTCGVID